ncbi:TetR/AcrR family transcriptional regulator [Streptomyces collinus]|uniref:TetR/AcrR family transcriptional regulator n=1 Tax=Streptomyces collinus TaxID=42684 RepID=UPI003627C47E
MGTISRGGTGGARSALVEAASALLTRGGPEYVTLRAVGAAAGVSRTAPYRHFSDKDDLLSAVAAQSMDRLTQAMWQAADDEAAGGTRLHRACIAYVRAAREMPAHYRLMFGDIAIDTPSEELERATDACAKVLCTLVIEAKGDGELAAGGVREAGTLLWAALHGLVDLTLSRRLREPRTVDGVEGMPDLVELALRNWVAVKG